MGWLVFPAAYLIYSLIRGPATEWHPYPFLDPRSAGGYGRVAAYSALVLVIFLSVGAFVRWWPGYATRASPVALPRG